MRSSFFLSGFKRFIAIWGIFFAAGFLIYFRASKGLLVDDGLTDLVRFKHQGGRGLLNSFGFQSLYYFHDIFDVLVYMLAGKSSLGWFIVMIFLHSINAALIFTVFSQLYSTVGLSRSNLIALTGSLLFFFSPYQTENVVWAATLHYAVAMLILLVGFIVLIRDLKENRIGFSTQLKLSLLFIISLLTLEITLVFPAVYFIFILILIANKKTTVSIVDVVIKLMIPFAIIICLYFFANRIIKGAWIPHYGQEHLENISLPVYITNTCRYIIKLTGFMHFWKYSDREKYYSACEYWKLALLAGALAISIILVIFQGLKKRVHAIVITGVFIISIVLLLPSLNMYFMYLFNTQNDRLSYFFSMAWYQILALVFIGILSYAGFAITMAYGIAGMFFLNQQIINWQQAATLYNNCINSYNWLNATRVYVLNSPTNYNGAYEFRSNVRLSWALDFYKDYKGNSIKHVLSSTYQSLQDSTQIAVINDSTLRIKLLGWGWWMNEAVGASDYDDSLNRVKLDAPNGMYEVTFHQRKPGDVYIYSCGEGFKEFRGF